MSQPAKQHNKTKVYHAQLHQIWAVLGVAALGLLSSFILNDIRWLIAKGFVAGAFLAFIGQALFTYLSYRTVGVRYAKQIMLNTYIGLMVKWLVGILGFALIFLKLVPISVPSVFFGFILMQVCQFLSLMRIK